jgi:hypothetical protein
MIGRRATRSPACPVPPARALSPRGEVGAPSPRSARCGARPDELSGLSLAGRPAPSRRTRRSASIPPSASRSDQIRAPSRGLAARTALTARPRAAPDRDRCDTRASTSSTRSHCEKVSTAAITLQPPAVGRRRGAGADEVGPGSHERLEGTLQLEIGRRGAPRPSRAASDPLPERSTRRSACSRTARGECRRPRRRSGGWSRRSALRAARREGEHGPWRIEDQPDDGSVGDRESRTARQLHPRRRAPGSRRRGSRSSRPTRR